MIHSTRFLCPRIVTIGVISVTTLFSAGPVAAEDFQTAGFEKIVIVAPAAQVNLLPGSGTVIRVTPQVHQSWSAREDGRTLRLTATTSPGVQRPAGAGPTKVDILIPPVNVDVHLAEGSITASKWTKPLLLDVQKGRVTAKDNRASLAIHLASGQAVVQEHVGNLRLDVFKADAQVTGLQGALDFSGHQSDLKLDKANGVLQVQLYSGSVDLKQSGGSVQFQTGKASLAAQSFKGRIEGAADEGPLNLQLASETEVQVKSGTGRVTLDSKNSGALLVLRAEEGDITGPRNMRAGRDRGAQVLRARLKGKDGGRVEVVAAKGNIVVKE